MNKSPAINYCLVRFYLLFGFKQISGLLAVSRIGFSEIDAMTIHRGLGGMGVHRGGGGGVGGKKGLLPPSGFCRISAKILCAKIRKMFHLPSPELV